jgi:hypothetical protein
MKNKLKYFIPVLLLIIVFASCKKDEHKDYFLGGTAPALTSTATGSIPLSFANKDQRAIKLSWTNPNYQFTTGLSSHDVSYAIEIDTAGANFTNPNRKTITVSGDLSLDITQNDFNDYLLNQLQLKPGTSHNLEIRITSSLDNNSAVLHSNVLKLTVQPYAIPPKVTPPASGKLFITGSATPASWMNGGDAELASQKFNQLSPTLYELPSVHLTGGASYLFVPVYGDWNNKYGGVGANNTNNVNGDDFKPNGGDLLAPAASGNYKIDVDFQRGKFTVTQL